jgi:hypothetical protein
MCCIDECLQFFSCLDLIARQRWAKFHYRSTLVRSEAGVGGSSSTIDGFGISDSVESKTSGPMTLDEGQITDSSGTAGESSVSIVSSCMEGSMDLDAATDLINVGDDLRLGRIIVTESDESFSDSDENMGEKSAQEGRRMELSIGSSEFIILVRELKVL